MTNSLGVKVSATDNDEQAVLEGLQGYRTVVLRGIIDEKVFLDTERRLLRLQLESLRPAHLVITSRGGNPDYALMLYDLIRHELTMPVHALVLGKCSSASVRVLLACKVRRSMPHARFVIHSGSRENITLKQNDQTEKKMARLAEEIRKDAEQLITFYQRELNKPRGTIRKLIERGDEDFDYSLSAEEALEIGLITEIVSGNAGIFPPLKES